MQITLNGNRHDTGDAHTVAQLLTNAGYDGKIVAVAVNNSFVPRTAYADHMLNNQDRVEIVAPMQGG